METPAVYPKLGRPDEWLKEGRKSALDLAMERTEHILQTHHVQPLDDDTEKALREIVKEAEAHYRAKGML